MKTTALAVALCTTLLISTFGQVYAPPPVGRGSIYMAGEINPNGIGYTGYFKVGGTGETQKRRRSKLNTGNPRKIKMVDFTKVDKTRATEKAVHDALAPWSVSLGGGKEWYYVSIPEDLGSFVHEYWTAIHEKKAD